MRNNVINSPSHIKASFFIYIVCNTYYICTSYDISHRDISNTSIAHLSALFSHRRITAPGILYNIRIIQTFNIVCLCKCRTREKLYNAHASYENKFLFWLLNEISLVQDEQVHEMGYGEYVCVFRVCLRVFYVSAHVFGACSGPNSLGWRDKRSRRGSLWLSFGS